MFGKIRQAISKTTNKLKKLPTSRIIQSKGFLITLSLICIFIISFYTGAMFVNKNKASVPVAATPVKPTAEQLMEEENRTKQHDMANESMRVKKMNLVAKREKDKEPKGQQGGPSKGYTDPLYVPDGTKVAYLTFDDGPTKNVTPRILDTLKQYDVKATFFVIGSLAENNKDLILRTVAEGHAVANHTYSHDYKYLYANTQNLLDDFAKAENLLKSIIDGYNSKIVRFPGGSYGRTKDRQAVTNAGYRFVDWNALNSDADPNMIPKGSYSLPADVLVNNLKQSVAGKQHVVILMHDASAKMTTAEALPRVIEYLKSEGYTFKTLQ